MIYDHTTSDEDYTAAFEGRKIIEARDGHLILDNDTALRVMPNEGGCSCGSGDYTIESLNTCDNIITKAELEIDTSQSHNYGPDIVGSKTYRLYVYAANDRINVMTVGGDDGDGFYGTGFTIAVTEVPAKQSLNKHLR